MAATNSARALLARNLRRIRLERGLTQEALSHGSGVMQSHLSEIEAGKRNASVDLIGAIALALAVPVAALFAEQPEPGGAAQRQTVQDKPPGER